MMSDSEKYSITQQEWEKILVADSPPDSSALRAADAQPSDSKGSDSQPTDLPASNARIDGSPNIPHRWALSGGTELLGIHLKSNTSHIIWLKGFEIKQKSMIGAGFDQPDLFSSEIGGVLPKNSPQCVVTLSGKPSQFFTQKAGNISRSMLLKSFRLQMKQKTGEDREDLVFVELPGPQSTDTRKEFLVASTAGQIVAKISQILRSHRLKILAWDTDLLCYARAISALWQKQGISDSTQLGVIMGWNRCRLIILGRQGHFIAPIVPMGISSFLENLASTLGEPAVNASWLEQKKLTIHPADSKEVKSKKILANQALFSLYVPFAQQIKIQLFSSCTENEIELPTNFTVLGPEANMLRIAESLEMDLGIKALPFGAWIEPEMAAAVGAALWDRHETRLNCLPRGKGEAIQIAKEFFSGAKDKWAKLLPKRMPKEHALTVRFNSLKGLVISIGVIAVIAVFPVWKRIETSRNLAKRQAELQALIPQKEKLEGFLKRRQALDKKMALRKVIESKQARVGLMFKEVLFNLPKEIRLHSISFRDNTLSIKGISQTQEDFEKFLELVSRFKYLTDPTPQSIRRENKATAFELVFKASL